MFPKLSPFKAGSLLASRFDLRTALIRILRLAGMTVINKVLPRECSTYHFEHCVFTFSKTCQQDHSNNATPSFWVRKKKKITELCSVVEESFGWFFFRWKLFKQSDFVTEGRKGKSVNELGIRASRLTAKIRPSRHLRFSQNQKTIIVWRSSFLHESLPGLASSHVDVGALVRDSYARKARRESSPGISPINYIEQFSTNCCL